MRSKGFERAERCFNLQVRKLNSEEASLYKSKDARGPTHIVAFSDLEHVRTYVGWVKENSEERLVFSIGSEKEYEFRPLRPHTE